MRPMLCGLAMFGAIASGAGALADPAGEAKLAQRLEGRTAGKPVNCISLHSVDSTEIIDKTAIVYRARGGKLYVNRPRSGAESLDRHDVLVTKVVGSQLCDLDIVNLLDPSTRMSSGFVGLGDFVPYAKVGR